MYSRKMEEILVTKRNSGNVMTLPSVLCVVGVVLLENFRGMNTQWENSFCVTFMFGKIILFVYFL